MVLHASYSRRYTEGGWGLGFLLLKRTIRLSLPVLLQANKQARCFLLSVVGVIKQNRLNCILYETEGFRVFLIVCFLLSQLEKASQIYKFRKSTIKTFCNFLISFQQLSKPEIGEQLKPNEGDVLCALNRIRGGGLRPQKPYQRDTQEAVFPRTKKFYYVQRDCGRDHFPHSG